MAGLDPAIHENTESGNRAVSKTGGRSQAPARVDGRDKPAHDAEVSGISESLGSAEEQRLIP
jgi:hypothetical protein